VRDDWSVVLIKTFVFRFYSGNCRMTTSTAFLWRLHTQYCYCIHCQGHGYRIHLVSLIAITYITSDWSITCVFRDSAYVAVAILSFRTNYHLNYSRITQYYALNSSYNIYYYIILPSLSISNYRNRV
jgi:hypothetical protein